MPSDHTLQALARPRVCIGHRETGTCASGEWPVMVGSIATLHRHVEEECRHDARGVRFTISRYLIDDCPDCVTACAWRSSHLSSNRLRKRARRRKRVESHPFDQWVAISAVVASAMVLVTQGRRSHGYPIPRPPESLIGLNSAGNRLGDRGMIDKAAVDGDSLDSPAHANSAIKINESSKAGRYPILSSMSRRRVLHWSDDSDDDDEFPNLANLAPKMEVASKEPTVKAENEKEKGSKPPAASALRRRKLVKIPNNNSLLRAWTPEDIEDEEVKGSSQRRKNEEITISQRLKKDGTPRKDRVELRTRRSKPTPTLPPSPSDEDEEDEFLSAQEDVEVSIIEDVSLVDDSFHSCEAEDSEFGGHGSDSNEDDDDDDDDEEDDGSDEDFEEETPPRRPSTKSMIPIKEKKVSEPTRTNEKKMLSWGENIPIPDLKARGSRSTTNKTKKPLEKDITDKISKLRLDAMDFLPSDDEDFEATPPSTPPKSKPSQRSLPSPSKLPRIPSTPHHASSDIFWSQEFVDDWNDQHSPVKTPFPSSTATGTTTTKSSKPAATTKTPKPKAAPCSSITQTVSKKEFSSSKQALAQSFLSELDSTITSGQLASLSASTGGIRLIWTNKLSTTAGRANWKRTKSSSSSSSVTQHHASIELSTKIISDPHRLLNVIAHEFCHLANFMVSGITTNPHGKEFKSWASKVTARFGQSHGIEVTTKHSYEIDFKYVWSCEECATEFKRHSKSIDTSRHRCGVCKGVLRQVKPVPRGGGSKEKDGGEGGGEGKGKGLSEYQVFMKEEMKRVKEENKGMKQNEVMRIVAGRWKELKEKRGININQEKDNKKEEDERVKEVRKGMEVIDLT
ncbi:SprT-like family-domain-containing protein [Cladorrhinum sp. PSN259]|nr:SprT-like family-domain-containing protein [Cladorrhinum sp. PSN259]